jgi:hypothetical protein
MDEIVRMGEDISRLESRVEGLEHDVTERPGSLDDRIYNLERKVDRIITKLITANIFYGDDWDY